VRCTGHAATIPGGDDGTALSLQRAPKACRDLRHLGLHATYQAIGAADRHPRADNDTETGRARNRRVDITITHTTDPDADSSPGSSIGELVALLGILRGNTGLSN
jgi:outer membrane protein OmpA-like peptidoglycan-associated protein